jgi:hypothetical protein
MANRAFPQRVTGELLVAIPVVLVWLGLRRVWVGRSDAQEDTGNVTENQSCRKISGAFK